MKTKKTIIFAGFIVLASVLFVFSCDVPLALGHILDINGPVVEFTSPLPRKTVGEQFDIRGTVSDESPVKELLVKTSSNNVEFAKQWRYTRSAGWQISENNGSSWTAYLDAQWDGNEKSAEWVLPIDLAVGGVKPSDGEYTFSVQAWDLGGFTDDNSFKTLVLIYDTDPPKVEVYNPYLYDKLQYDASANQFKGDLEILVDAPTWKDPSLLGKFISQEFQLQWQIEDDHDIWSIELLFYEHDADIDGLIETEVPQDYIYYYHENLPPVKFDPLNNIKPNGSVLVPDLAGSPGQYDGGTLKKSLNDKTVIKVVSICYDAADHVNQEKVLGYIVFWPQAAQPWITFTDGMFDPSVYNSYDKKQFEEEAFMVYPGRNIRANAFQAQGVSRVEFTLHLFNVVDDGTNIVGPPLPLAFMEQNMDEYRQYTDASKTKVAILNPPRPNGSFSTIFPWNFLPEARTNNYVVRAVAFDFNGKAGNTMYEAAFRVQDITFPDFPTPPNPTASEPLFKFIGRPEAEGRPAAPANSIRISGVVADATDVVSVYIAWINPESVDFAAMSQLSYFRDANYKGWLKALGSPMIDGSFIIEDEFDKTPGHENKVWKVATTPIGEDPDTGRKLFRYEQVISLTDLKIGIGNNSGQPLNSQVFLLRAENPDEKCTIITYAPPGDTGVPTMEITNVVITGGETPGTYTPGQGFIQIPKFTGNETITVNGIWREDSTEFLDSQLNFYNRMEFKINGVTIPINGTPGSGTNITVNPGSTVSAASGTFTVTAEVRNSTGALRTSDLTDTLVVNVSARDIGNNRTEDGASWLILSDTLRFLRISSENEDRAYRADDGNNSVIKIFLEFNKAVVLKQGRSRTPVLMLNTGGIATYDDDQNSESTRHYFTYTVGANHNTTNLNVTGISIDGGANPLATNTTDTVYQASGYPFTFINTNTAESNPANWTTEEIRLTRNSGHTGGTNQGTGNNKLYYRAVPVDVSNTTDRPFTLGGGKSISVDNTAPTISTVTASPSGWHKDGVEIYITATFSEDVRLGSTTPYLLLNIGGTDASRQTSTNTNDIRVNNKNITFKYVVKAGDTATAADLQVNGFGGDILDIPGNRMTALGGNRTLAGIRLDTSAPAVPTVTVWQGTAPASNGAPTTGNLGTSGTAAVALGNIYNEAVFVRIAGSPNTSTTETQNLGRLEYTLNGTSWTSLTSANLSAAGAYNIQLSANGPYTVRARQIDQAGNPGGESNNITFNLDRGTLITSISSTNPNGDYTNNTNRADKVEIQVNFRKPLTLQTGSTLTLNVTGGATATYTSTTANQAIFTYSVAAGHTTDGANLNVTGLNFPGITDGTGTVPATALALPASNLGNSKAIKIVTGGLTVSSGPTYTQTGTDAQIRAADSWTGTISITFNRNISKGTTGNITIAQDTAGYRLPAVLTEAQSTRYRSARNFSANYTRGTNGFINGTGSDTATKYVLNYTVDTPVTPSNTGSGIAQMAYDFLVAETVTLPITSQDVTVVNDNTLRITLTGSNALQVLGAAHTITIPINCVQDSLDNTWPAAAQTYNYTTPGINRSFIRVDKQINRDTVARTGTGNNASTTVPWLTSTQPTQTRARLDCRTPNSVVRYNATGTAYNVTGTTSNNTNTTDQTASRNQWTNTDDASNRLDTGNQADPQTNGTNYTTFTGNDAHITVGDANEQGYVWRITARGRNSATGNTYSDMSDEVAFRTVLTYQLAGMVGTSVGAGPASGDALWIRGGDAISSSSVPGFPLTWGDDYDVLRTEGKRAGIRLMRMVSVGNNFSAQSEWKWVTWEINVQTYFDVVLGRDVDTGAVPDAARAWQYGPRTWAYQRGGWTIQKDLYTLYPGKHRWLRLYNTEFVPGGPPNWSTTFQNRPDLATSTQ